MICESSASLGVFDGEGMYVHMFSILSTYYFHNTKDAKSACIGFPLNRPLFLVFLPGGGTRMFLDIIHPDLE